MKLGSIIAIYFLIWSTMAFLVLPFGIRTAEEAGEEPIRGQADSAPVTPDLKRKMIWNTALSTALFVLFYLNYQHGWLELDDIVPWLTPN